MNKFNIGDKVVITGGNIYGSDMDKGKKGVIKSFYIQAKTENYRYEVLRGPNYSTYPEESLILKKEKPKRKELLKKIEELETKLSLIEDKATALRKQSFEYYKYEDGVKYACDLILNIVENE